MLNIAALLITLAALFGYLNVRYLRLPVTIGVMSIALLFSLSIVGLSELGFTGIEVYARKLLSQINFYDVLMNGLLSLLLFAGALHINLDELADRKWPVALLATGSTVASTFIIGITTWYILAIVGGVNISLMYALLFGALISPTDPVAVLGILKSVHAPRSLETLIAGESLFNDGVAVVVFTTLLHLATGSHPVSGASVAILFAKEAIGGVVFGLGIGFIAYRMLKNIDDYRVEVTITLALALGGYALALYLSVSGPIAMVVAGLLIGKHGRALAMSDNTRQYLDKFWEMIDEILNVLLFTLIGFEMIMLTFTNQYLLASLLLIPTVLLTRFICVGIPISVIRRTLRLQRDPHAVKILTWAGLRGGISVALALSLPAGMEREILVAVTYTIVVFSILIQGLTVGKIIKATIKEF